MKSPFEGRTGAVLAYAPIAEVTRTMTQTTDAPAPPSKGQAGADPYAVPLDKIDVSDSELFETDTHWRWFERLRNEAPVHYCAASDFGPYWSVTRYHDIVQVEKNPEI